MYKHPFPTLKKSSKSRRISQAFHQIKIEEVYRTINELRKEKPKLNMTTKGS